jgi:surface-anchored protein
MNTKFQLTLLNIGILATIMLPTSMALAHETSEAQPAYYLVGHGDLDIGFDEGQLDLHIHVHAGGIVDGNALAEDTSLDPDNTIIVATQEAKTLRPAEAEWDATGVDANTPLWVLPQQKGTAQLPRFGLATEDIDPNIFVADTVTLTLRHVKGPGRVSLWQTDALGVPQFQFSTHAGLLSTTLPVGLHAHYNWGFTQPGTYTLVLEVTGDLVAGGSTRALGLFTFLVSENPIPLQALAGDVNADGAVNEADLAIVQSNLGLTVPVWPSAQN